MEQREGSVLMWGQGAESLVMGASRLPWSVGRLLRLCTGPFSLANKVPDWRAHTMG